MNNENTVANMKLPDKTVICPVVNKMAYSKEAVIPTKDPDGWYKVDIFARTVKPVSFVDMIKVKPTLHACSVLGNMIPTNFDIAKRKTGLTSLTPIFLLPADLLDFAQVSLFHVRKRTFFLCNTGFDVMLITCKAEIDAGGIPERQKGMRPEQVYALGCYAISIAEQRAKIEAEQLDKRLGKALSVAGAELIEYKELSGDMIDVTWKFLGETFLSTVYGRNLMAFDSGICLSGADKKHSLSSVTFMAKEAIETGELYKTREA